MDKNQYKLEFTKKQLFDFILNWYNYRLKYPLSEDVMTLSELIEQISNNSMMFDSWVNNINVMD